jgi:non-heme chloroperoxidase
VAELVEALGLSQVIHVGHSTGGGEVIRYVARSQAGRVAKAVLIAAVTPIMLATDRYPAGLPLSVFDGFRAAVANNRARFFIEVPSGPFYGFNRDGVEFDEGLVQNWWRQGMMGGAKAHYDCIEAFSETDFTDDLRAVSVPVLLMHGEDDQVVPVDASARVAINLLSRGSLKTYPSLSHGLFATHPQFINEDLLAFFAE